jgi:Zn-dependent protease with chaperone function/competence protein ComGC
MSAEMPASFVSSLTVQTLTLPKERSYQTWVMVISILVWAALAVTIIGLAYVLLIALLIWFGNGLLVAHLRSNAVKVSPKQMPELNENFNKVCETLGLTEIPALYVLESGGALNAFAMRHTGRTFVVVYANLLEALGPSSREMAFILGHEIGHIKSQHILKQIFLAPGLFAPLVGPAYRRSWESSCDRYGAFASGDIDASIRAMQTFVGGRVHGPTLNTEALSEQYSQDRGFFVSLNELTSTYPTLSRRISDLLCLRNGYPLNKAERQPFAYLVALFVPGMQSVNPMAMILVVVMIGLFASMSIPAFQKVRQAAIQKTCYTQQVSLETVLDQYYLETGKAPQKWEDLVGAGKRLQVMPQCPSKGTYSAKLSQGQSFSVTCSVHGSHNEPAPHE